MAEFENNSKCNSGKPELIFLITIPFFKRISKKDNKKASKKRNKKKDKELEQRKAQAMELKSIIHEMVDELQYMERSSKQKTTGMDDNSMSDFRNSNSFSGRSKDISDFETMLQARRKELELKAKESLANEYEHKIKQDDAYQNILIEEIKPDELPDDITKRVHYKQKEYPKNKTIDNSNVKFDLPEQPETKPTEEGAIEFDESKYFHEFPASEPLEVSEKEVEIEFEEEIPKRKTKLKKSVFKKPKVKKIKHKKTEKKRIQFTELEKDYELEFGEIVDNKYIDEIKMLDDLLDLLELIKNNPKDVDFAEIINSLEQIVTDYREFEERLDEDIDKPSQKKGVKGNIKHKKVKKRKKPKKLEELEELEEIEELEELDKAEEEEEELEELEELEEVDDEDVEELEELEELEEVD